MPHSLRAKLSGLRYKGILEDKDYKRLCKALDNENVLDKIRAEIKNQLFVGRILNHYEFDNGLKWCLEVIDRHMKGDSE